MTIETIELAQEFLTVNRNSERRKIIDIEALLSRHPPISVVRFLERLLIDKKRVLKELVTKDKTDSEIDRTIASCFRIQMALNNLEREIETEKEVKYGQVKQRAEGGI